MIPLSPLRRTTVFAVLRRLSAAVSAAVLACTAQPLPAPAVFLPDDQLTLPVISIETESGYGFIKDSYVEAAVSILDETGAEDMTDTPVRVRLRGNSSRSAPKKSYKLHFPEKANPLQLGEGKAKTWALIGNYFDASLLRNRTAYQISSLFSGIPYTPHCRSAELYIDGEYYGVYLLAEAVSVNKHRVHITEAQDLTEGNGYLLEMTRYAQEPCFLADCFQFEIKSTLSEDADTALRQTDFIAGYTRDALRALKSGDQAAAEQYLDIPSLADNCLVNEICKNVDVGWDSYYLSKDAGGKLVFQPVWDFDIAFGNCGFPVNYTKVEGAGLFSVADGSDDCNPWLCYALRCAWFRDLLKTRWEEMLPALREVPEEVLREAEEHADAYQRNFARLNNAPFFLTGDDPSFNYYTHPGQVKYLSDWITARLDWLDSYYHSPEFADGIFPDEQGNPLPVTNELAVLLLSDAKQYKDVRNLSYTAPAGGQNIAANFSDLMLAAGQPYLLSFACSTTGSAEVECQIQTESETFTETFAVTAEPQTCEFRFVPETTSLHGNLLLFLNGTGTVSISDLKLEKQDAAPVTGDVDRDGRCDAADVLLVRDWLLCLPDAALPDWRAADLSADGRLDARDLTLLKRAAAS